jgi:hypothetical protein
MAVQEQLQQERRVLPFGEKARKFCLRDPRDDRRINILEGSVRSAKTWAMIPKILTLCAYKVQGHRVIFGVSKQTIYNNVLSDLFDLLGAHNYSFNRQTGELYILGVKWLVIGAKDEGSEKYVRGLTVGIAVGDELVLIPPSFVRMMLNRMSPDGARFYATTNPDSPLHYVKTDLLDNAELRAKGEIWSEHFDLYDNPNITGKSDYTPEGKKANDAYRSYLKMLYKGVYYQRFVLGLWVVAEGSIYKDCWSEDLLYDDSTAPEGLRVPNHGHVERYIGTDCGVDHPQVYLDVLDDGTTLWFDREYFWDSNNLEMDDATGKMLGGSQKTDREYADDLEEFLKDAPNAQVILPPECASFRAELIQRGIWLTDADNEVLDGIKMVCSMMNLKRIRVHRRCKHLLAGIATYVWDQKAKLRGVEQPLKKGDDCCDAKRYVVKTKIASWRLAA